MFQFGCKSLNNMCILILVILSICSSSTTAHQKWRTATNLNPNIPCPGKNQIDIWQPCKHGGYIVNHDPKNCADRYVCYVGLNEKCHPGDRCADNAICTVCNLCQKCESSEKCSDFSLCPGIRKIDFLKRFIQKRLIEYSDNDVSEE